MMDLECSLYLHQTQSQPMEDVLLDMKKWFNQEKREAITGNSLTRELDLVETDHYYRKIS